MNSFFEQFRNEKFHGVSELAAAATKILTEHNVIQSRETVAASPDERTVRYYLAENLISASEEKQGTSTIYNYFHLLQLLAIKKLQAEHLSIRQIRQVIAGHSEQQLEDLLIDKQKAKNEAQKFLESLLSKSSSEYDSASFARLPKQQLSAPAANSSAEPNINRKFRELKNNLWERCEIEAGLELNINKNYTAPSDDTKIEQLLEKIKRLIENYRSSKRI